MHQPARVPVAAHGEPHRAALEGERRAVVVQPLQAQGPAEGQQRLTAIRKIEGGGRLLRVQERTVGHRLDPHAGFEGRIQGPPHADASDARRERQGERYAAPHCCALRQARNPLHESVAGPGVRVGRGPPVHVRADQVGEAREAAVGLHRALPSGTR
jgi:hypothetical protein